MSDIRPRISYANLSYAQYYYQERGFKVVEAPWIVPSPITQITFPRPGECFTLDYTGRKGGSLGDLVGSGEQSFLHMIEQGKISLFYGNYQCITPCFRDDVEDKWHQKYFMKLELISGLSILEQALEFFTQFGECRVVKKDPATSIDRGPSWDIEAKQIATSEWVELGSYGQREHPLVGSWHYGTGCAEPRMSQVFGASS